MTAIHHVARWGAATALALALGAGSAWANDDGGHDDGGHNDGGHHGEAEEQGEMGHHGDDGGGHHGDGGGHGHGGHHGDFAFGQPGKASEVDRTVEVTAENLAFDRDEIGVKPGETVRFVIRNEGNVEHDFTIGPPELQKQHRKEMRKMMGNGGMDHSDPNAVMVQPGETKELIWRFDKVGSVMFGCNVPGHYERMHGQFTPQG